MKRKFAGMAAALLAAVSFFPCKAQAISAQSAILVDGITGRTLYEKNANEQSLIASTTKIMTALIICEQSNVLDRMRIPKEAVGIEGSSMYLREGEVLTLQELLYGLMLQSGNDAAVALAIYCGGTVEGFAELMNDKARQLGMHNSHFVNPNGLDAPDHYSTAADMAILARYAMENPIFARTVSAKTVTAAGRQLRNHNKLLWQVEGADGVKTGYTKAAGRILVSSASRQGRRLVAVTINAPNDWQDHKQLLEDGFSRFQLRQVVKEGCCLRKVDAVGGLDQTVELLADEEFTYAATPEEKFSIVLSQPGFVYAPVVQGQEAGFAHILLEGEPVGKVRLIYGKTIEQKTNEEKSLWDKIFRRG